MMKKWLSKAIVLILCLAMTGCGLGNGSNDQAHKKTNVPMGRYVEEAVGFENIIKPEGDANFWIDNQGKLQILVQNETFVNYELEDSGEWKETDLELCKVLNEEQPEISYINQIIQLEQGTYYLFGDKKEGEEAERQVFVGTFSNHEFTEIDMEWETENPIILHMAVDENENIVLSNFHDKCMELFTRDGKLKTKLGNEYMNPVILEDKIVGMGNNKIEIYDMHTYAKEKTIEKITCDPKKDQIFSDYKNAVLIATSAGVFRLSKESDILEKIVEGSMSSLSMYYTSDAIFYKDEMYMLYTYLNKQMAEEKTLRKLTYREDVPAVATEEITIWSVTDTAVLQDAATVYKQQHPDTCIKFEVLYDDEQFWCEQDGDIDSEDLEALSTQLLAGEGPDLIVLDGLPIEAYRKQGIFSDLTSCIETSSNENELLSHLVTSYSEDNKIDAIPLAFSYITAVGEKRFLQDGFKLKDIAAYQESHPDERVMFPEHSKIRVRLMADYLQNELFNEDGKVNKKMMTDYLRMIKSIAPDRQDYRTVIWRNTYQNESGVLSDIIKVDIEKVSSLCALQTMARILDEVPDSMITDKIEQEKNIVQGCQVVAINENSKNKEVAEELIKIALSEEVQGRNLYDGFPVNVAALEEMVLYDNHSRANFMWYDEITELDDGTLDYQTNDFDFGYFEEMQFFLEQFKKAKPIKPLDEAIRKIMKQETEAYFKGTMSLEETVDNLEKKINLYISEQGK